MAGHKPTSSLANVVLPEAEGPTTANTSPGFSANCTPRTMAAGCPGAPAIKPSTDKNPFGTGKDMLRVLGGTCASKPSNLSQPARTLTTALHCDTNCAKGANTRPPNTEPMIIIAGPPFKALPNINQAPSPSKSDPIICCTNLDMAVHKPAPSEACA